MEATRAGGRLEMVTEGDSHHREVEARNAAACPVIHAINQFGTPWRMNVVYALEEGEKRFNELKRATGARSKTLSDTLDKLVEHEIVTRRQEDGSPVAVYYDLTPKGADLLDALDGIEAWSRSWGSDFQKTSTRVRSQS